MAIQDGEDIMRLGHSAEEIDEAVDAALGISSTMFGGGCSDYGTNNQVGGKNSSTSGNNSILHGLGLVGDGDNQAIFGTYNATDTNNTLFKIGNGRGPDSWNRSNALALTSTGDLTIAGGLTTGDGKVMTDENYTTEEKVKLASITNPLSIKGRVDTVDDLPNEATVGWLYFVGVAGTAEFAEYVYTADETWEQVGVSSVDLSLYYTADETDAAIETATADKLGRTETAAAAVLDGAGGDIAKQFAVNRELLADVIDNGYKNLLKPVAAKHYAVDITINENGEIVLTGVNTSSTSQIYRMSLVHLEAGVHYTFIDEANPDKYYIHLRDSDTLTAQGNFLINPISNTAKDFTVSETRDYLVALTFYGNDTYENFVLRPMICKKAAYDISPAFVPYHMPLKDIESRIAALESEAATTAE